MFILLGYRQVWQQLQKNGKETPQGSFLKYTVHEFLKILKQNGASKLYEVNAANKSIKFGKEIPLSVEINSTTFAKQKLEFIHFNLIVAKGILLKITWSIIIHQPGFMKQE